MCRSRTPPQHLRQTAVNLDCTRPRRAFPRLYTAVGWCGGVYIGSERTDSLRITLFALRTRVQAGDRTGRSHSNAQNCGCSLSPCGGVNS